MFTTEQKAAIVRISFFILYADGKIEDRGNIPLKKCKKVQKNTCILSKNLAY